jgi:hypothetical protein
MMRRKVFAPRIGRPNSTAFPSEIPLLSYDLPRSRWGAAGGGQSEFLY